MLRCRAHLHFVGVHKILVQTVIRVILLNGMEKQFRTRERVTINASAFELYSMTFSMPLPQPHISCIHVAHTSNSQTDICGACENQENQLDFCERLLLFVTHFSLWVLGMHSWKQNDDKSILSLILLWVVLHEMKVFIVHERNNFEWTRVCVSRCCIFTSISQY